LRELSRSYLTIVKDLSRVMNRLKAVYRSWGDSLCRQRCVLPPASSSVAGQDREAGVRGARNLFFTFIPFNRSG
jgi:hypothetical protein